VRKFKADKYKRLFEDWNDPIMKNHEKAEKKIIQRIAKSLNKTFIDLGAGYGRILSFVSPIVKNVISIEINPDMYDELETRSRDYSNTKTILGDVTNLSKIIEKENIHRPVLLLLQNTLGTIEGDWKKLLKEMKKVVKKYQGEVLLSLYRQQALENWGIMTYWHGVEMNGKPDMKKTDLKNGFFVSKTGYTSKWWTDKEIEKIKDFFEGEVVDQVVTNEFIVFTIRR